MKKAKRNKNFKHFGKEVVFQNAKQILKFCSQSVVVVLVVPVGILGGGGEGEDPVDHLAGGNLEPQFSPCFIICPG